MTGAQIITEWPEEAREAAQLVLDEYGEPDHATEMAMTWEGIGPWKRVVATRTFLEHNFPAPHTDSVESFIDYQVPTDVYSALAEFDGSVIVERTAGEVSARCHDLEANSLALNLMNDIVTGAKNVDEARRYYAQEFLDYRRQKPTPYMDGLQFTPGGNTVDPDERLLSDEDLERAVQEGETSP